MQGAEALFGELRACPRSRPRRGTTRWLTCQQEGDEAGLLGHEELQAGPAEDVLHHGLGAAGALQEGQELLRLLGVLRREGGSARRAAPTAPPLALVLWGQGFKPPTHPIWGVG